MTIIKGSRSAILMLALLGGCVFAFNPSGVRIPFRLLSKNLSPTREVALHASRRSFVENFALSSIAVAGASLLPEKASASGGATAGGVYLLSAKQRYNGRVTKGVKGFLSLGGSLESGSIDDLKTFFKSEEDGMWKDFSAAAYLLANAFRRNSTAAPDTLPSVKVCIHYPLSMRVQLEDNSLFLFLFAVQHSHSFCPLDRDPHYRNGRRLLLRPKL
jgi:hypothetical protein